MAAQTVFTASNAPGDTDFADGTVWFSMKLKGCSISAATSGVDSNSYFYASSSSTPSEDGSLWCIVGDATNGYKFYNKSGGVTKVFAINNTSGDNGGKVHAKLVDASTAHSTEDGADNWATTFDISEVSAGSKTYYVTAHGTTNKTLNQRSIDDVNYVSTWTTGKDAGSYVTFYNPIYSFFDNTTDKPFGVSSTSEGAVALWNAAGTPTTEEFFSGTCAAITTYQTYMSENFITPSTDKLYYIRNAYNNKYISPSYYPGDILSVDASASKKSVWKVEANEDGTFKLKNVLSDYYAAGTSSYSLAETGSDYSFALAGTYNATCVIGQGTDYNSNNFFHANQTSYVISYLAYAGASRWYFDEVSEDDYKALSPTTADGVRDLLSICFPSVVSESDINSFIASPTSENFQKIKAASESQDGMYVRLTSAKSGNKVLALNSDYTTVYANDNSTLKTDVATIWQLERAKGNGSGYYLKNMNSGTYIGTLFNADGTSTSSPMVPKSGLDGKTPIKVTLTKKSGSNYNVIDGNGNKMNDDGRVNYWTNDGNPGWAIFQATDIEVALHTLGDASYATVYLPVSISSVSDATPYVAKNAPSNGTLSVTSSDEGFAANAGVVLVSDTKAETATLTIGESTVTSELGGTTTPLTISDASSYLVFGPKTGDTSTVGFYQPGSSVTTIPANRAFYQNASGAVSLNFGGSVTAIDQLDINAQGAAAPIYDLTGRKVSNMAKGGLYIKAGKKFIVK